MRRRVECREGVGRGGEGGVIREDEAGSSCFEVEEVGFFRGGMFCVFVLFAVSMLVLVLEVFWDSW
jgi:hypothetical protein